LENNVKSLQDNITALQNDFKNRKTIELTDVKNNFNLELTLYKL